MTTLLVMFAAFATLLAGVAQAAPSTLPASAFADLAFAQHPGAQLPGDVTLTDEQGRAVRTGDLFAADKPLVLVFDYFRCTTLCGVVLGDLAAALAKVPLEPGRDYGVLAVSIDPAEMPADGAALKAKHFDRDPAFTGAVRFLTGEEAQVRRLADAVGFAYRPDPAIGQFAHPAGLVLLAPGGVVSRYILGIGYHPMDLRLGIVEASTGTVASVADHLLLLCYAYDPAAGKYNLTVAYLMKGIGALSMAGLGLVIARAAHPSGRV
ncbi:SCO family protein [Azospirillum canadense]|uniref:SCO family protein n=1 Tax=Azospirillum canadense TaxID=403962 RepID=UPI002226016D|nr:SCO family protein [Azospirillum canadense]MCW2242862.1 protein SCO1/2 [Azospirillum canadense]